MARTRFVIGAILGVLWVEPLHAQATKGTIRGRITDEATHQALSGVVVTLGHRSALTQNDGRYVVAGVPAGADSLRARLLGYAPVGQLVEVVAGLTLDVDLAMTARAVSLAEVVVVGYGQQSAGNVTGAVSKVSAEEFNTGRIISPALLIQSKVPGVQVVDNNEPGGGLSIRIRGTTSVNASSEPLYVIDGTPVGSGAGGGLSIGRDPLASLNPDEIESITVLRDASAAAIYGANAANGVVLISTKQGRQGTQFEYCGSMSGSYRRPAPLDAERVAICRRSRTVRAPEHRLPGERQHRLVPPDRPQRCRAGLHHRAFGRGPEHELAAVARLPESGRRPPRDEYPAPRPRAELPAAPSLRSFGHPRQSERLAAGRHVHAW